MLKTDCKYCGHTLRYTKMDNEIKCYKCLTIHYVKNSKTEIKENLIYSMYPTEFKEKTFATPKKTPHRCRFTV